VKHQTLKQKFTAMIKNIHFSRSLAIAALAIFMLMPGLGWGQLLGDYRSSATSVDLNVLANWETYDGTNWVIATAVPNGNVSTGNTITILSGHTWNNPGPSPTIPSGVTLIHQGSSGTFSTGVNNRINNNGIYIHNTIASLGEVLGGMNNNTGSYVICRGSSTLKVPTAVSGRTYYNLTIESTSGTMTTSAITASGALLINGNLNIGGSGAGNVIVDHSAVSGAITIVGNISINSSCSYIPPTGIFSIFGDIINNGTLTLNSSSNLEFNGSSTVQSISGSSPTTFGNLKINNGNGVTLSNNVTVTNTLTLSNGIVTTGSNTLNIDATGSVTGASATSYVDGKLAQVYSAAGSKTFPIGKGVNYRPLTINYTALTGTSTVTVEQTEGTLPGTSPANTSLLTRYWTISQTGGSAFTYKISLDGTGFTPGQTAVMLKGDGSLNSAYAVTTPNYTNTVDFASFSNFGLGDMSAPTAYAVTGTGSYCIGGTGLAVGIANSELGVTYTITPGGATVEGNGSAISFGNRTIGTYTVSGTNLAGTTAMTGSAVITETSGLSSVAITPITAQAFCATASGTQLTATETGGGAITRQWGKRSVSGGTIEPIAGATSQTYTPAGTDLGTGTWYIVCTSTPSCGSVTTSAEVTVIASSVPSDPKITHITPTTFCTGENVLLTSSAAGDSYLWSTGAVTQSITVTTSGSYTVQVTTSGCQSLPSAATVVTVNPYPSAAGTITGPSTVTQGDAGVAYSVPTIANATSYTWAYTVGTGATITGTTKDITIAFSLSATSGNLTVKGSSTCGFGTISANYFITVNPLLTPGLFNVTGGGSYCSTGTNNIHIGLDGSQSTVNYQLYKDAIAVGGLVAGTGSPIDFGVQPAGTYTVKGLNGYTADMTGSAVITALSPPTANAGSPDFAILNAPYLLSGATATNYSTVTWSIVSGTGGFDGTTNLTSSILQPTFTCTAYPGSVVLRLTASNGFCTAATATVQLTVIPAGPYSKTWTGGSGVDAFWNTNANWNPGIAPLQTEDVTIPSVLTNYPIISGAAICNNLTIQSGSVTVASGGSLTVVGALTNSVGASGLVVKSGGSLIETSTGVAATVEVNLTGAVYHSYSPSVTNAKAGDVFYNPANKVFIYSHSEANNADVDAGYATVTGNDVLQPMSGYAVKATSTGTFSQTGTLNQGSYSRTNLTRTGSGTYAGFNYVGNPYPSYIDWNSGSMGKTNLSGATYVEAGGNWASYIAPGPGILGGSNIISPSQGFFVEVTTATGTLSMNNNVRTNLTTPYLKSASATDYVRLVATGNNKSDETVVRFAPETTPQYDSQYDALKMEASDPDFPQIYSISDKKLSYNALPETNDVQLGFTAKTGTYTISQNAISDVSLVTLEDTKTGIFTIMDNNTYTFDFTAGENENRFILHFGALAVKENKSSSAAIYSYQQTVHINMKEQVKGDIYIYNITGQLVATKLSAQGTNEIKLPNVGNYIVKVITRNNTVIRKVFIQ
jgi:hypothetical protein